MPLHRERSISGAMAMEVDARPGMLSGSKHLQMNSHDGIWTSVAQCLEQLRTNASAPQQKEMLLRRLLDLMSTSGDARTAVSCHPQSIPVLVTMLRSTFASTKNIAAMIIEILSKDAEARIKVLLGGSIPPLLALLKTGSLESQMAAARALYAVSQESDEDKVGPKIFASEGAVPYLWEQLKQAHRITKPLDGVLLGALRNLNRDTDGFWEETNQAGGLEILLRLLFSGSSEAQCHSCYLLAKMIMNDESVCANIMQAGCVDRLLRLLSPGNDFTLRAEAAGALKALSCQSKESRRLIVNSNGISALINATVAPSKEAMGGEVAQALQENAMGALANVAGGWHSVIRSMAESIETNKSELQVADTLGALASALMVFDGKGETLSSIEPQALEGILMKQIRTPGLVQERTIEALATLYSNKHLQAALLNSEVKKMLVGLITMTSSDMQEEFLKALVKLCSTESNLWYAVQRRQGVQLLISLLGISTEEQQDCAVSLLSILSQEHDESKWAITAAGGIPPLVQLLESGSIKAKEDAAIILGSLCTHSEDIRSCVEKAGAVPALLWLLKNASPKGQEIAAQTLNHLVSKTDAATISQLNAMLTGDVPEAKKHVLDTLMHFLSISPLGDMLYEGSPANESFHALIAMLGSFKEETQQHAASMLAKLLKDRKDLRESPVVADIITPLHKILLVRHELIAMHAAECLSSLFMSIGQNPDLAEPARKTMTSLLKLCRSTSLDVLERTLSALANLFQDQETAKVAPLEDIVQPLTRVLREGTLEHKADATSALSRLLQSQSLNDNLADKIHRLGTLPSLLGLLATASVDDDATLQALEVLAIVTKSKKANQPLWEVLVKSTECVGPLVKSLAVGQPVVQNKAIEVLSRFYKDHPVMLGDTIANTSGCITALADRVVKAPGSELQVEAAALMICTAKEHRQHTMNTLQEENCLIELIQSLVQMLITPAEDDFSPAHDNHRSNGLGPDDFISKALGTQMSETPVKAPTGSLEHGQSANLGKAVALWLLSILATCDNKTKCLIAEAGAIEAIDKELENYSPYAAHETLEDKEGTWVSAFLLAILFQEKDVLQLPAVSRAIPILATLLKSGESADRYFASQSVASLVFNGDRSTILAIANSGAPGGLINLLGSSDLDNPTFVELAREFALVPNPAQTALEHLFRNDDIKLGSTARKVIPPLVELLKPSADRPDAPLFAQGLLTLLATGSHGNKLTMAEAGVLEGLTRYLSLGPQDNMEECTADLLRILFSTVELRCHESAVGALNQLVALLRLGGKGARFSAGRALQELFAADHIKNHDAARQAIPPFMEMLRTGSEKEQRVALRALSRLSHDNPPKAMVIADPESGCLEILNSILWADCSMELKEDAAGLCFSLFSCPRARAYPTAANCIEPLVLLLSEETARPSWLAVLYALNNLLDSDSLADIAVTHGAIQYMVAMLSDMDQSFHEIALSALVKLGKTRLECKVHMVRLGVIDKVLSLMPSLSDFACASAAELLQILTDTSSIAKEVPAASIVEPLLLALSRPSLSTAGQYSTMQVLVNVLGNSHQLADYKLSPKQPLRPLILLLDSPSKKVQHLASELFSHLLVERRLDRSVITKKVVNSLVQLAATGSESMQQKAVFALETASNVLPQDVADAGGILEVSKVILQLDPLPPHELWESACSVICNILNSNSNYFWQVPVEAFVRMLQSDNEATVVISLQGMLALEKEDPSYAEAYARSGAIDALLELLRCHQCEEAAAQVLEALLNDKKVRTLKTAYAAVGPLAQYLLDQETKNKPGRLLSALALGDLFQQGGVSASSSDVMLACKALMKVLEEHSADDIRIVTLSAFQNVVRNGRVNKQALADSGAVDLIRNLLCSSNKDTAGQAAKLTKLLFSNQTISEHASTEIIRALSVALQNDLSNGATMNADIIQAIAVLFSSFPKLRSADAATLCIPQLTAALKAGSEAVQDATLEVLYLLRQGWSVSPADVTKAQALEMAEAIPALQEFIKSGGPKFHERSSNLLLCLPGSLVVTIKQGKNLKQKLGSTNAFCKITLGNSSAKETKVVPHSTSPEWNQGFAWPFDTAPKGQKVHIVCKNKGAFSKGTLGKVTIQVDRVIALGTITGNYTLQPNKNRDGTPRVLEIEITWSHR